MDPITEQNWPENLALSNPVNSKTSFTLPMPPATVRDTTSCEFKQPVSPLPSAEEIMLDLNNELKKDPLLQQKILNCQSKGWGLLESLIAAKMSLFALPLLGMNDLEFTYTDDNRDAFSLAVEAGLDHIATVIINHPNFDLPSREYNYCPLTFCIEKGMWLTAEALLYKYPLRYQESLLDSKNVRLIFTSRQEHLLIDSIAKSTTPKSFSKRLADLMVTCAIEDDNPLFLDFLDQTFIIKSADKLLIRENIIRESIQKGARKCVKYLLKKIPKTQQKKLSCSPAYYASLFGTTKKLAGIIIPEGEDYDMELWHRIKLAHLWEVRGQTSFRGTSINLEGAYTAMWIPLIQKNLSRFHRAYPSVLTSTEVEELQEALEISHPTTPTLKILESIEQGKTVILPAGWKKHSIEIVIVKSYLLVCNIGQQSTGPVNIWKIDRAKITESFIEDIRKHKNSPPSESITNTLKNISRISEPFPSKLHALLNKHWQGQTEQKVGNCTWTSLQTAIYAYLMISRLQENIKQGLKNPVEQVLATAYESFESWHQYFILSQLQKHLTYHETAFTPLDPKLVDNIFNSAYKIPSWKLGFQNWFNELRRQWHEYRSPKISDARFYRYN